MDTNEDEEFEFRLRAEQEAQSQAPMQPSVMDFYGQETAGKELERAGYGTQSLVGFAAPMVKTYYGAKELVAGLSPEERSNLQSWQQMEEKAPLPSTIAGTIAPMAVGGVGLARAGLTGAKALYAPTTVRQAAAVGGGYMALQPTGKEQLAGAGERLLEGAKGALLSGAFQKIAQGAGSYLARRYGQRGVLAGAAEIDDAIENTLRQTGQSITDLPPGYADELRQQVASSLQIGKTLDVPSALRAQEFKGAGIEPTLGQVTRDPMQYATERNLSGVTGVGEPLLQRFSGQETALRGKISDFAKSAVDRYQAGANIGSALEKADEELSRNVSKLYQEARKSAGKDLELPLQGLAQDYATVVRDFGDKIPSGVRNNFENLGLLTGKQNKVFTVEEADRLLKVINSNISNDPAVNAALTALRNSVKGSVTDVDASGGVFAPAVKAAAQRFKMHDMLPALQQAAKGEIDADKFVAKHIVGAKPESVNALAKMLKSTDEAAFNQAKAQVGEHLLRSAYGINPAGDAGFRSAGFSKALDSMGERLKAFYTPEEIQKLKQLSRVGAYMSAFPARAPVSTSSSGVPVQNALMSILGSKIPFLSTGMEVARGAKKTIKQRSDVARAISADAPSEQIGLLPGQVEKYQNRLSSLASPFGYASAYELQ